MRLKFRHSDKFMFLNIRDYQETMKVFSLIRLQLAGAQGQTRTGTPKQKFLRLPSLPFHHLGKSHLGVAHHPSSFTGRFFLLQCKKPGSNLIDWLTVSVWSINTIWIRLSPKTFSLIIVLKSSWAGFFTKLWNAPFWDYCNYIIINYCIFNIAHIISNSPNIN